MRKTTSVSSRSMLAARVLTLLALAFAAVASPQTARAAGPLCYVDEDATGGANTGTSWTDAYTSLKTATDNSACTEIWVAEGVYKPGSAQGDRFLIEPQPAALGVALYGGFAGGETDRSQRNPATHVTILSGDIDDDDTNHLTTNIDDTWNDIKGSNSYNVLYIYTMMAAATSATVVDGFIITGGQGPASYGGGGLICVSSGTNPCSPTLSNLTFSGNKALAGGALYNMGGTTGGSSPTLSNVVFHGNYATASGGAIYNYGYSGSGNPTLTNVTFEANQAAMHGGAMFNFGESGVSSPSLTNVTFDGNHAGLNGGAMYNDGSGAGSTSSPTLTNVTFSANSAGLGGAMLNDGAGSEPVLRNVILWGDTASGGPEVYNTAATPKISYSVVQGGCASITGANCGAGNLSTDPKLAALADNGGSTKTMALTAGSSAIDTGTNTGCPAKDQRGVARPQGAKCDIGAYELSYYAISGNARVGGATLTYTDGVVKHATSAANGTYSLTVTEGWSGNVTPTKTGCTFTPTKKTYTNVTGNKTGENYSVNCTWTYQSAASQDGWVLESGENTNAGGTISSGAATIYVGDNAAKKQYRGILSFNTSALPDSAVITKAQLKLRKQSIAGGGNPFSILGGLMIDMRKGYYSTAATLQTGDFQAAASKTVGPFNPTPATLYTITLPSTAWPYINKLSTGSGLTQIRLRFKVDDNNDAIANYISFYSGNAGSANRPVLTITFHAP